MMVKAIGGLVLALGLVASGLAWSSLSAPKADCCIDGAACCAEGATCCTATVKTSCCVPGAACCYAGSPCCENCCAEGAACCTEGAACCTNAKSATKAKTGCCQGGGCGQKK